MTHFVAIKERYHNAGKISWKSMLRDHHNCHIKWIIMELVMVRSARCIKSIVWEPKAYVAVLHYGFVYDTYYVTIVTWQAVTLL